MNPFLWCLNSSTIRPAPLLDKIRIAGECGYSAIELWHDDMDAFLASGGTLSEIRRALDDHGLSVPTTIMLKGWCDTTGADHQTALTECRRRLEQAAAVGAQYAIAGPTHGAVDPELAARNYRELLELGLSLGVAPAMEYLGFAAQINTIESALEIVRRADHPRGTVVLDPFHVFRGGGSVETIAQLTAAQIAISHFNDAPRQPPRTGQHDKDRVLPGDGHLDLRRYLQLLAGTGFRGCLSLELFSPALWDRDPREVARIGLERMQACVADALGES